MAGQAKIALTQEQLDGIPRIEGHCVAEIQKSHCENCANLLTLWVQLPTPQTEH